MIQQIRYYKVLLFGGQTIKLDTDEIQGVVDKLPSGQLIRVRNGVFSSSIAAIILDEERTQYSQKKDVHGNCITDKSEDIFEGVSFTKPKQQKLLD